MFSEIAIAASLAAIAVAGCGAEICTRHSDCPFDELCGSSGVCALAPLDAAPLHDAPDSIADANPPADTTVPDGSAPDASSPDAAGGFAIGALEELRIDLPENDAAVIP